MNFSLHKVSNLPILVIDNFFSQDACDRMFQELLFLNNHPDKLKTPEETGSATRMDDDSKEKILLKKNKGMWLDNLYADRSFSNILEETKLLFSPDVIKKAEDADILFRYIGMSNSDTTLITYYDKLDYYDMHTDDSTLTAISWFYKKPRMFLGGELMFEDGLGVDCEFNRMVIFPSVLFHSVNPVILDENLQDSSNGRFAITKFIRVL